jgi:iron complex transport system permease protein
MNRWALIFLLLVLALATISVAPFCGMERIPLHALWGNAEQYAQLGEDYAQVDILWKLRIPRVLMAFMAGASLAVSGMVFQAVFRNPLADPFTLGVSSGASLGASLYIQQGCTFALIGISGVSLSAFVGAVASIALVYLLTAASRQGSSTATMLLAGVAVSFLFSSVILFLQYICNFTQTYRMLRWTLGGLETVVSFRDVWNLLPFMISGCLIAWYLTLELNLLCTGDEFAFSRGVHVQQTKLLLFFAVSLMVGAVVAVCGPIGFVGLMAPHICRLVVGPDHRYLLPAAWLFGGAFLVVCDTVSRMALAPTELPVGIVTALLGGPFFLWLLLGRRREIGNL